MLKIQLVYPLPNMNMDYDHFIHFCNGAHAVILFFCIILLKSGVTTMTAADAAATLVYSHMGGANAENEACERAGYSSGHIRLVMSPGCLPLCLTIAVEQG